MLDFEEARLPIAGETISQLSGMHAAVHAVVEHIGHRRLNAEMLTADIIGITRVMPDMAVRVGKTDAEDLANRVHRTILNYLRDD